MNEAEIYKALAAPFPLDDIEWRVQSTGKDKGKPGDKALMLAYVTARAVFERLTDVLGIGGWSTEHRQVVSPTVTLRKFKGSHWEGWGNSRKEIPEDIEVREQDCGWACKLTIRVGERTVSHEDASEETDIAALKGGFSKSLVRCAVRVGIGAYLYDMPKQWVTLEGNGPKGFPPRDWKPDISKIPPDCRPAKGGGRTAEAAPVARLADPGDYNHDEPKQDPPPPNVGTATHISQPAAQVVAAAKPHDPLALQAWHDIEWAHSVIPVPFMVSEMTGAKDPSKNEPFVFFARCALLNADKKAKSGHWGRMRWVLDTWPKEKGDGVKDTRLWKRLKQLDDWAREVLEATEGRDEDPGDPLDITDEDRAAEKRAAEGDDTPF